MKRKEYNYTVPTFVKLRLTVMEVHVLSVLLYACTHKHTQTPMNMASTRSHCIFTIHIMSREPGSDMLKKSKLHLVDLAGLVYITGSLWHT